MTGIFSTTAAFLIAVLLSSGNASAQQVFKCLNSVGKVEFSDVPCQGARTGGRVEAQGNSIDSSGSRELQLRFENERLKEQLREQERRAASAKGSRTQQDLQAERVDSFACEKAKRDYEVTANSNSSNASIVQAKRSMMYGACGMREPDNKIVNVETRVNNVVR